MEGEGSSSRSSRSNSGTESRQQQLQQAAAAAAAAPVRSQVWKIKREDEEMEVIDKVRLTVLESRPSFRELMRQTSSTRSRSPLGIAGRAISVGE